LIYNKTFIRIWASMTLRIHGSTIVLQRVVKKYTKTLHDQIVK